MHIPVPDRRWRKILQALKSSKPPNDAFMRRIYDVKKGLEDDETIRRALDIIEDPEYRDTVITYCLCGATLLETSESLCIPQEVLKVVNILIIDVSEFEHKMELLRYARYFGTKVAHKNIKQLVEIGLTCGPNSLVNHHRTGHEPAKVNKDEMLNDIAALAYHTSKLLRVNPTQAMLEQFVKMANVTHKSLMLSDRTPDAAAMAVKALIDIATKEDTLKLGGSEISVSDLVH